MEFRTRQEGGGVEDIEQGGEKGKLGRGRGMKRRRLGRGGDG